VVLSMDGIYWGDSWYSSRIKPVIRRRGQKFLAGDAGDVVLRPVDFAIRKNEDSEMSTVELVPEIRGKVDGIRLFDPDRDAEGEEEEEEEAAAED
jgi:hypothetical protein